MSLFLKELNRILKPNYMVAILDFGQLDLLT